MSTFKQKIHDIKNLDKNIKIAFISAEFNRNYTEKLEKINWDFLIKNWFKNIKNFLVPWAFEIPWFTKQILEKNKFDLIITFWVVIKWDTPHFEYVCENVSRKIMDLTCEFSTPIIFWILTCNTEKQVEERITETFAISWLNLLNEMWKI